MLTKRALTIYLTVASTLIGAAVAREFRPKEVVKSQPAQLTLIWGVNEADSNKVIGSYKVLSCSGDCKTLFDPTNTGWDGFTSALLVTDQGKIAITHNQMGDTLKLPSRMKGAKLIACFCDQQECLKRTPFDKQFVLIAR